MRKFEYKLAIIVRKDLKMGKGKLAVQASHASIMASEFVRKIHNEWWKSWIDEGQKKIALKVNSEIDLFRLKNEAENIGLPVAIVHDSGLTQLSPGTVTCIGIGPAPSEIIDRITKDLPLL